MRTHVWILVVPFVSALGCSKPAPLGTAPPSSTAPPPPPVTTPEASEAARVRDSRDVPDAGSGVESAASAPRPEGTATLVLQKVYADCGTGGWAGSNERVHLLGTDVLVLIDDGKGGKPTKEYAFCPSHLPDGGATRPRVQVWQNCESFPSCKVLDADGGSGHVEVQCGAEHVVLESVGGRTILRGSFGERELVPRATEVAPVQRTIRHAMVDC